MADGVIQVSDSGGHTTTVTVPITVTGGGQVQLGVNTRYYDDFVAKVWPVNTQRIYCATQSVTGSWYTYARDFDAAGGRCSITMKTATTSHLTAVHNFLAQFETRPIVDYYHEPDDNLQPSAYIASAQAMSNALRDVADIAWCPRALNFASPGPLGYTASQYWPGSAYIDLVACDGYFKDVFPYWTPDRVFGDALDFARLKNKPFGIFEWGIQSNLSGVTPTARANQMRAMKDWMKTLPEIRYALYWESGPPQVSQDFQFRDDAAVVTAYREMAQDPFFTA